MIASAVIGLVAAGVAAYGQHAAGQAQQDAYKYNAKVAQLAGDADATRSEVATRRKLAEARAAYGAAGVAVSEGTPLEVAQDLAMQGKMDEATIRWRARLSGQQDRFAGESVSRASKIAAGGTLLSGLAQAGATTGYAMSGGGGTTAASIGSSEPGASPLSFGGMP